MSDHDGRRGEVDTATLFSGRADAYRRFRPGYPPGVVDLLACEAGWTPASTVADIGSGTGISSALFLERGNTVHGVEPNAEMRLAADAWLAGEPAWRSVAGTAEHTTLGDASVDLVVCATSFHWFDAMGARAEFRRILRPGGFVVLMWNVRRAAGSPFMRDYEAVLHRFEPDYAARTAADTDIGDRIRAFYAPCACAQQTFDNPQTLDLDGLKGRFMSASYAPLPGDAAHEPAMHALDGLFARFAVDGRVTFLYDTFLYWGRLG